MSNNDRRSKSLISALTGDTREMLNTIESGDLETVESQALALHTKLISELGIWVIRPQLNCLIEAAVAAGVPRRDITALFIEITESISYRQPRLVVVGPADSESSIEPAGTNILEDDEHQPS